MSSVVIYCRSGFENDAAAEISHHAAIRNIAGYVKAKPNEGYLTFICQSIEEAESLIKKIDFRQLIFARQWFAGLLLTDLPQNDRISAITHQVGNFPLCGELRVETTDTNEGKELSKFCKKISMPLSKALEKCNKLTRTHKPKRPVLHALFLNNSTAYIGFSFSDNNASFPMGIPRLKMPADGPSRSTLKLDEAFKVFFTQEQLEERVRPGMTAVDLGACPGGWTYQLVRRGLFVTAIDNGAMDEKLMKTGQVEHLREDGFKYRPERGTVNWLVCDMVEKPTRITQLMIDWIIGGHTQEAIFNLKLPMKKRFETVYDCLEQIDTALSENNIVFLLQAKQLYHDREEVTLHIQKL